MRADEPRYSRRWRAVRAAAGAGLLLVLLAGCAGLHQPEVERVAEQFAGPATPAQRCALLAPATVAALEHQESAPCAQAIAHLSLPGGTARATEVWGDGAQVRLTGDTLFLTRTNAGWRVAAAGCTSRGDAPYVCQVEGP